MTRTEPRGLLALALSALAITAACGSDSDDTPSADSTASVGETTERAASATTAAPAPSTTAGTVAETTASPATTTSSATDTAADASEAGRMVDVTDVLGTQEISITDDGLFALDEYTGLTLVALGAPPENANAFLGDDAAVAIMENAGVTVSQIGRAEPSIEAIANARPDLIVGTGHPNSINVADLLGEVSPVVLTDFQQPWDEQMRVLATVTGTGARAQQLVDLIDAKIEQTAESVRSAGVEGSTISIIVDYGVQTVAFGPDTLAGTLVEQVGLTRPASEGTAASAAQDASLGPFIAVSDETLVDHDADIVIGPVGKFAPASINDNILRNSGGDAIAAAPDADVWNANTPLAAYWILTDIERIVSGSADDTLIPDDVAAVWEELTQ
ncbi:MAG: ABC transporter substrate-binding protein [Actinomycetota bacterium]